MSDAKLRELERRWRETKSVEDEAAYLRERVRVGDLTQERLDLASFLGSEAAQIVGADWSDQPRSLGDVLPPCGREACLRAGVALGRAAMRAWRQRFPDDTRPIELLDAIVAWIRSPGTETQRHVETAQAQCHRIIFDYVDGAGDGEVTARSDEHQAALTAAHCAQLAGSFLRADPGQWGRYCEDLLQHAAGALGVALVAPLPETASVSLVRRIQPRGTIGDGAHAAYMALVEQLLPWVLKWSDPLRAGEAVRGVPGSTWPS